MKLYIIGGIIGILLLIPVGAKAATDQGQLPTKWTYTREWVNTNLLTWRANAKLSLLVIYATDRASNIVTATNSGAIDKIPDLSNRYIAIETKINSILTSRNLANKSALVETIQTSTLNQQQILSEARQKLTDDTAKQSLATIQSSAVNQFKSVVSNVKGQDGVAEYANQVVATWRDPGKTVANEEVTRVYAPGTYEATTSSNNGVIIDGGQAKVSQGSNGDLKIEYAPGTGPSSVTANDGKKIWKIQQSNGTTIDSYSAASNVVAGGVSGNSGNVVVNTVSGGTTSGAAQTVVGGGPSSAPAGVKVEGGIPASNPAQTQTNTLNSTDQSSDQVVQ